MLELSSGDVVLGNAAIRRRPNLLTMSDPWANRGKIWSVRSRTWLVAALLFGSGFCALVYQVAWLRDFRLIFGASTAASAAVLAIFIGGLGVGGLLLGPRADRHPRPLLLYAQLELIVAVSAAATPLLLAVVRYHLSGQRRIDRARGDDRHHRAARAERARAGRADDRDGRHACRPPRVPSRATRTCGGRTSPRFTRSTRSAPSPAASSPRSCCSKSSARARRSGLAAAVNRVAGRRSLVARLHGARH